MKIAILITLFFFSVSPVFALDSQVIFNQVNTYRQGRKLSTLSTHPALCEMAAVRAKESVTNWSHQGFYSKANALQRKYRFAEVVENLVKDYSEPKVVPAWLASPTHKRNLDVRLRYGCVRCFNTNCAFIGSR